MTNYHEFLPTDDAVEASERRDEILAKYRRMLDLAHELKLLDVTDNADMLIDALTAALQDALADEDERARLRAGMLATWEQFMQRDKDLSEIREAFANGDIHHPAARALLDQVDDELMTQFINRLVLNDMSQTMNEPPALMFALLAVLRGQDYNPKMSDELARLFTFLARFFHAQIDEEAS
jgi:hypothetical protein